LSCGSEHISLVVAQDWG